VGHRTYRRTHLSKPLQPLDDTIVLTPLTPGLKAPQMSVVAWGWGWNVLEALVL